MLSFLKGRKVKQETGKNREWIEFSATVLFRRRKDGRGYARYDAGYSSVGVKSVEIDPPTLVADDRVYDPNTIIIDHLRFWDGFVILLPPKPPFTMSWKAVFQEPQSSSRRWVGLIRLEHHEPALLWGHIRFDLLDPAITGSAPTEFGQTFLIQIEDKETIHFAPVVVSSQEDIDLNKFERLEFERCERVINAPGAVVRTTAVGGLKKKVIDDVVIFEVSVRPNSTHSTEHGAP